MLTLFYFVDFHSALTLPDRDLQSLVRMEIYNVNVVKMELHQLAVQMCVKLFSCFGNAVIGVKFASKGVFDFRFHLMALQAGLSVNMPSPDKCTLQTVSNA